jgi:hypothetical protein
MSAVSVGPQSLQKCQLPTNLSRSGKSQRMAGDARSGHSQSPVTGVVPFQGSSLSPLTCALARTSSLLS